MENGKDQATNDNKENIFGMDTDANHFSTRAKDKLYLVSSKQISKINPWTPQRHTRESGYPEALSFPGFRVALAIASLPGMTPKREKHSYESVSIASAIPV
jgi:hypothetical protein